MTNIQEIWIDLPEYEGYYQISNLGRIKTVSRFFLKSNHKVGYWSKERISLGCVNHYGYMQFTLAKDGNKKKVIVHRLIARYFIGNPENKRTVNHKNGVKTDNKVDNLEWLTDQENNLHSFRELGRVSGRKGKPPYQPARWKPVKCLLTNQTFSSCAEAGKALNINSNSIRSSILYYNGIYFGVKRFEMIK